MQDNLAYIFPAFVLKYTGKESNILESEGYPFSEMLKKSSKIVDDDLSNFHIKENNFLDHELRNQYMSYIFSCSFSDILKKKEQPPSCIGGFSMGIYAALYHAGAIEFADGLWLIKQIFNKVKEILAGKKYSMMSVIGFTQADLDTYLKLFEHIECVIQNGEHSFVLSGPDSEIEKAMNLFHAEGAMHLAKFTVSCPYHSSLLLPHQQQFSDLVRALNFKDLTIPLFSFIKDQVVKTALDAKQEIANNVTSPLDFHRLTKRLNQKGITSFIEVGPGDSLTKSSKFIEGDFKFRPVAKGKVLNKKG